MNFEESFKEVLEGREEVYNCVNSLTKFNDDDFKIEISSFISYRDFNDEDYEVTQEDEYPGFDVYINPVNIKNYKYSLLRIELPVNNKKEYPVLLEFKTLNRKKKLYASNLEDLNNTLNEIFSTSTEYKNIIKRLKEASENA